VKNGIHHRFDLEAALSYVVEKMLMDKGEDGLPRTTVFSGFEDRPGQTADFNPLQARFMRYLDFAVRNIVKGKIARLAHAGQWPQGTVSIGQGRAKKGDPVHGVSPDQIAGRPSDAADMGEMIRDIEGLLRRKEPAYGFPLVELFRAIMGGMNLALQRQTFGDRKVKVARTVVIDTIRDYAQKTENYHLQRLLRRLQDGQDREEGQARRTPNLTPRPVLSDKERDYSSIADVVARFDRPVGTADLGKYRRRWLDYPPRDPSSGHRNRLEEVLAAMTRDGVLRAIQTRNGATVYGPGPAFERYRPESALATVEEGLLLPDAPSVPGMSRINTSLFPLSRYREHPNLRPPRLRTRRVKAWPSP
jgi:hypothetical protein